MLHSVFHCIFIFAFDPPHYLMSSFYLQGLDFDANLGLNKIQIYKLSIF